MHRFFIEPQAWDQQVARLEGSQARQIARVLRMKPGDHIVVLDNSGWEYELALEEVQDRLVTGSLQEKRIALREPRIQLSLYQSLLKRENFEWVLQKCTEIGAARFIPTLCERTIRQENAGRLERWSKIVQEAAEQSGRGRLPEMTAPLKLPAALGQAAQTQLTLIAWEEEQTLSLGQAVADGVNQSVVHSLAIFIGPEGGFSTREIEIARSLDVIPVSLGKRILRAETAAVVATTIALQVLGEMQYHDDQE